jgi:hypothetical protein
MNEVHYRLIYPRVDRVPSAYSEKQRVIDGHLNIGCDSWKTNTAMRKGFCDTIFAGAGNHPHLKSEGGQQFDWWRTAKARSMSVGDVVNIDPAGLNEFWICESCGWILLTAEQATSWLEFPRKYGCDMFELREWFATQKQ